MTYEIEADGILIVTVPFEVWRGILEKSSPEDQCLKLVIEYYSSDSLCGLKFDKYFDYPGSAIKQYAYTEPLVNSLCHFSMICNIYIVWLYEILDAVH